MSVSGAGTDVRRRPPVMIWILYGPVILVILVAIAAGISIVIRKLRGKDDNPYIDSDE